MSLDFVEAIPSKDRLTQGCCPFHRERLAEGCRPESEKVQALPTRSTTQLRIQSPVSSDTAYSIYIQQNQLSETFYCNNTYIIIFIAYIYTVFLFITVHG